MLTVIPDTNGQTTSVVAWTWPPVRWQLVSLWDMQRIHAGTFTLIMTKLALIKHHIGGLTDRIKGSNRANASLKELASDNELNDDELRTAANTLTQFFREYFGDIITSCRLLKLDLGLVKAERVLDSIDSDMPFSDMHAQISDLSERIEDELQDRLFMFVPPDQAKYFDNDAYHFGDIVKSKFPESTTDIVDASRCLGAGLPTGAVYYLMRVMECGIHRLVRKLRIRRKRVRGKTWDAIIKTINKKIDWLSNLPNLGIKRRALRDQGAEASAHLNNVRIAWRNPTMHAERTYTPEEAAEVFENVKAFMNYLAVHVF